VQVSFDADSVRNSLLHPLIVNSQNLKSFFGIVLRYFVFFILWDVFALNYSAPAAAYDALAWTAIFAGLFWRAVEPSADSSDR